MHIAHNTGHCVTWQMRAQNGARSKVVAAMQGGWVVDNNVPIRLARAYATLQCEICIDEYGKKNLGPA